MPKAALLALVAVLLTMPLVAAGPRPAAAPHAEGGAPPDFTGTLTPCCDGAEIENGSFPGEREFMNREPVDFEALSAMKAAARFDPNAPVGVELESLDPPPGVGPRPQALAPGLVGRIEGVDIFGDNTTALFFPPDAIVAASETKVFQATNTALMLTGRAGGPRELVNLNAFVGKPDTLSVFDPKIYYDRLSRRFFLTVLGQRDTPQQSFVFLAVSRSDTPDTFEEDDWCRYELNSRREGSYADYPGLGVNENWVAVSVNNFRFTGQFNSTFIYAFPKAPLVANAASCPAFPGFAGFRPTVDADGVGTFTIQPAQHYTRNPFAGTPLFFVSTQFLESSNSYAFWRLTGTGLADVELSRVNVRTNDSYGIPPDSPQGEGGRDLHTGDLRITQAAYRDGKLWAVHATSCSIGVIPNESCVRAIEITPDDTGGSVTFEETFGNQDWFAWWPGVAINGQGDVVVAFQRSRGDRFLDVSFNGKRANAVRFDAVRTLKLGQCPLLNLDGGDRNRTGDYVGAQADPADDQAFWIAGEYAADFSVAGCFWGSSIGRVRYPPTPPGQAAVVAPVGAGRVDPGAPLPPVETGAVRSGRGGRDAPFERDERPPKR